MKEETGDCSECWGDKYYFDYDFDGMVYMVKCLNCNNEEDEEEDISGME